MPCKETIDFKDYKQCLFADMGESVSWKQLMFQSRKHKVHMVEMNKLASNRDEDK